MSKPVRTRRHYYPPAPRSPWNPIGWILLGAIFTVGLGALAAVALFVLGVVAVM